MIERNGTTGRLHHKITQGARQITPLTGYHGQIGRQRQRRPTRPRSRNGRYASALRENGTELAKRLISLVSPSKQGPSGPPSTLWLQTSGQTNVPPARPQRTHRLMKGWKNSAPGTKHQTSLPPIVIRHVADQMSNINWTLSCHIVSRTTSAYPGTGKENLSGSSRKGHTVIDGGEGRRVPISRTPANESDLAVSPKPFLSF